MLAGGRIRHSQVLYELDSALAVRDESMLPNSFMPGNHAEPFDLAALAGRFQSQTSIASLQALRAIEGYGLYGAYELTVLNHPSVRDIEDFQVEIAYVYLDLANIRSEQQFIVLDAPKSKDNCKEAPSDSGLRKCKTVYFVSRGPCDSAKPPEQSLQWLDESDGLGYLFVTRRATPTKGEAPDLPRLCKASVALPEAQQAHSIQRMSSNLRCSWTWALAELRAAKLDRCKNMEAR